MYGSACASAPGVAPCTAGDPYARYAPAAATAAERPAPGGGWRAALLGTVAAGALAVTAAPGHAAPGPCIVAGNTVTCTGDQSAGIASGTDFDPTAIDTLNINSLTGDITPPAGVQGILFERFGAGDTITINSTARISATGANAVGIEAHADGAVTINHTGDITTTLERGIFARSDSATVAITSTGVIASGGDGIYASGLAGVTISHTGNITSAYYGVYAYSGNGPVAVTTTGTIIAGRDGIYAAGFTGVTVTHTGDITAATGRGIYATSGNGPITITSVGNITAQGDAIFAENCGCGPGDVTITHTGDLTSSNGSGIYASGAGVVTITSRGTINANVHGIYAYGYTSVAVSHRGNITATNGFGIYASSPSGTVNVTSTGNIAANGYGILAAGYGNVTVQHTGDITSTSTGIYAVSVNGTVNVTSTGNITAICCGISAVAAGDVTITHTGNVTATNLSAISAFSLGGNVNVTVNGGTIVGQFAGIQVVSNGTSTINIGPTATVTGTTFTIVSGAGDTTVNNSGIVTGDVNLAAATNQFNNLTGGLFNSGTTVIINGTLFNSGTVAPGGIGTIQTTNLTGNFVQNAGGRFAVDVDLAAGTSDVMIVTGTATIAGYVVPNIFNTGGLPQTFTILSAAGGVTDNGLTIHNTAVITVDGQLLYPNPNDIQLQINSITVNFAPSGLTPNQNATAQHLHGAYLAGSGNLTNILNYLSGLDFAAFAAALDQLHPEPYLASVQTMLWSGFNFGNSLMSCPAPSETGLVLAKEGSCLWLRAEGHTTSLRASPGFLGFSERAGGFSAGVQRALTEHWFVSAAIGYERSEIDVDTRARARGNVFHGGAALKYIDGNFLAAASVNGGFARYDTTRFNIPTAGNASADADIGLFSARLRFAYTVGSPVFHVKPLVDFELTGLFRGAINESGAGALNLQVRSKTDWVFSAAPALEFAGEWREGERHWRPYLRLGVRFLSKDSFSATALFQGSPAGTTPFTVTTPLDQALGEISAGVDVWQAGRYSLRLGYDGRFGEHTRQHGGQLKLRAAF